VSPEGRDGPEQSSSIRINLRRSPADTTVVEVVGDLSGDAVATMQRTLTDELTYSAAHVIVDMSEVTRIDTDAINALATAAGIAGEADISLCLVHTDEGPVGAAIAAAELTDLFEVYSSVEDAARRSP
jgi:anti-sigma B factor antagonist